MEVCKGVFCSDDVQIGFSYIFMCHFSSALITAYLHEKQIQQMAMQQVTTRSEVSHCAIFWQFPME
jgi:hypothetical protein